MTSLLPASSPILYIWPAQWGLQSFDPLCLAATIYLQLAIPGKFSIAECNNPDASPTGNGGQLPYLIHGGHISSGFTSIVKYVSSLRAAEHATYPNADLDVHLSTMDKAKRTAWSAHAESHLGNLVYYTLFSNAENWTNVVHPALAEMFPIPQKYYVPRRIRDVHYQKLTTAGLWNQNAADEGEKPSKKPSGKEDVKKNVQVVSAFEREKVLDKARIVLDLYDDLLKDKSYLFQNELSSIDTLIASHIILLTVPAFPDSSIKNLVTESYPHLLSYANNVYSKAFESGEAAPPKVQAHSSFWTVLPSWPKKSVGNRETKTAEDRQYDRLRWGFFGVVLGAFTVYLGVISRNYTIVLHIPRSQTDVEEGGENQEAVGDEGDQNVDAVES